jgi:hypothetical protein
MARREEREWEEVLEDWKIVRGTAIFSSESGGVGTTRRDRSDQSSAAGGVGDVDRPQKEEEEEESGGGLDLDKGECSF